MFLPNALKMAENFNGFCYCVSDAGVEECREIWVGSNPSAYYFWKAQNWRADLSGISPCNASSDRLTIVCWSKGQSASLFAIDGGPR